VPVTLEVHSANEAPRSRCARGGFKFPSRRFGPGPCATPSLSLPPAALKSNPTKATVTKLQYAISAQLKLMARVYHRIHEHLSAIRWIFNRRCRSVEVRACRLGAHAPHSVCSTVVPHDSDGNLGPLSIEVSRPGWHHQP
jgi:hypothetical protein